MGQDQVFLELNTVSDLYRKEIDLKTLSVQDHANNSFEAFDKMSYVTHLSFCKFLSISLNCYQMRISNNFLKVLNFLPT